MTTCPAIVWFRRDLRVTDHPPLLAAINAHNGNILPVYVVSSWKRAHRWTGEPRQRFLCGCLAALAKDLAALGGRLLVRAGPAEQVLERLVVETGASAIYFHNDSDPFGRETEGRISAMAKRRGVATHGFWGISVHPPESVRTAEGKSFRVFSPFARAWNKLAIAEPLARPARLSTRDDVHSEPLPGVAHWGLVSDPGVEVIAAGERAARQRLKKFLGEPARRYEAERDTLFGRNSSRLSQDLRFGTISAREVVVQARKFGRGLSAEARGGVDKFIAEVAWRDFYLQLLWQFPEVLEREFNADFRGLPWRRDEAAFSRWSSGETGFPLVDAGMRELNASGFMHNRARMVVSMFLTKDLHVDWRAGEQHFMQRLVDGDIASNNGGWQWSAGCGADAAPYFRIQNPWLQSRRYDPVGDYIKRWIPDLRDVPVERLHAPPEPSSRLARNYPPPMVDHAVERDETLRIFKAQLATARRK